MVTGDPHALDPYAADVVNHALVKPDVNAHFIVRVDPDYEDSLLILDNAYQWNDQFGADWYKTALIGIGFMLGLERATDLPSSTLMSFASDSDDCGECDVRADLTRATTTFCTACTCIVPTATISTCTGLKSPRGRRAC